MPQRIKKLSRLDLWWRVRTKMEIALLLLLRLIFMHRSRTRVLETEEGKEPDYIYYVDKKKFKEGDVVVCQEDQSRYVIKDVGVLEGVYCTNQGYAVSAG